MASRTAGGVRLPSIRKAGRYQFQSPSNFIVAGTRIVRTIVVSSRMATAEGEVWADRAGVILTQLFHHGNEHRAHICTILGAHVHAPPSVSAWGYAGATGRTFLLSAAPQIEGERQRVQGSG